MEDVAEELSRVPYLSPAEFHNLLGSGREYTVIDTRKVHTVNDTLNTTLYKSLGWTRTHILLSRENVQMIYSGFLPFFFCAALHNIFFMSEVL